MALQLQKHLYSVNSSAFYHQNEIDLYEGLRPLYLERNQIRDIKPDLRTNEQVVRYAEINKEISVRKAEFKEVLSSNTKVRSLNSEALLDKNIISSFISSTDRILGIPPNTVTTDMFVVRTYYYDILRDLMLSGFYYNNERYIFFTASAGQLRTKKCMFIRESVMSKYSNTLMCGLTKAKINACGGINVNKFMAYSSLMNTASDIFPDFDIDRCVVVDDFETSFMTKVDYIDEQTYKITPKTTREVVIPHMDGAGICLPGVSKKAMIVRMPWVKGLLAPFDFIKFINKNKCSSIITDIYGKEYDVIKDDIKIILTKSQFKMHKYYSSWDEYKDNFKKYSCEASIVSKEPDYFKQARLNYQMLQTLIDISDAELSHLCRFTNNDIKRVSSEQSVMLRLLGADKNNLNKTPEQEALSLYPELLKVDEHFKSQLRDSIRSLTKKGKAGKFRIDCKYTYIIPDLYAFCEWLFLGKDNPDGLLANGEVYCDLYKGGMELDVLRSPHLYMEHAVRKNNVTSNTSEWFISHGIYTSVHDTISKILQFDCDGDTALVVGEQKFVEIAKRNVEKYDIVPLYYDMKKAGNQMLTENTLYDGMIHAYSGGNIGEISNNITAIWNDEDIDMDCIKYLCMETNFCIDYAKTLYKPVRPPEIDKLIRKYTKKKVPSFFKYAKDKKKHQVEPINNSTVNRLNKIVKTKRVNVNHVGSDNYYREFNIRMLMDNPKTTMSYRVISKYESILEEIKKNKRLLVSKEQEKFCRHKRLDIYQYQSHKIKNELCGLGYSEKEVVDNLLLYLYGGDTKKKTKKVFWIVFGDVVVANLKNNIKKNSYKPRKHQTLVTLMK